jgi:predicted secreted protein
VKSLKIASILLLTIISLSTFSAVSAASNTVFEEKQINVHVNEKFNIELPDISGSSGYCWNTQYDLAFISLTNEKIVKTVEDPYFIGGYNKIYTFTAKNPGQTKIIMTQSRPWSNEMPAKVITYIINIE